ncbi:MAG: tetratricopeptide repeat protein [Pseudomonadota bacterium]
MTDNKNVVSNPQSTVLPGSSTPQAIPLATRLAFEIQKPKDWQAFQRQCVVLFCAVLGDPYAQEYGRGGQAQKGIDILGRRDGATDCYVGIQCRLVTKPLKKGKILDDCRAALTIKANLKEIVFATTAPDDTVATDAATEIERILREEGYDLKVILYGWGGLQTLIGMHESAYAAFVPSAVATTNSRSPTRQFSSDNELAAQIAAQVVQQLQQSGLSPPPCDAGADRAHNEDPALHARIDIYREIFKDQKQPILAEKGLLALLEKETLDSKPWARFRIETNLGSIALELGREEEGAKRFEAAFVVRSNDPNAIANLALARTIQKRYEEAMSLARQALDSSPRPDHAVGYLLQAAARSTWQGDPQTLIPPDLVGSEHADLGLTEFLRRRNISGWEEHSIELSRRHLDREPFKKNHAIAILSLVLGENGLIGGGTGMVTFEELNIAADELKRIAGKYITYPYTNQHDLVANLNNAGVMLRLAGRHDECEALLREALPKAPNEPSLRRLIALSQAAVGRREEALATLSEDDDVENRLLSAELAAIDDSTAALTRVLAVDPTQLNPHLCQLRWGLTGELALKVGDTNALNSAVAALRAQDPENVTAALLEVRGEQKNGLDLKMVHQRLCEISANLPIKIDMVTRYLLAEELFRQGLPSETLAVIENHVDLSRRSPITMLYLQSLVGVRRDDAFFKAIAGAAPAVRDDPDVLWMVAIHSWNVGDLLRAYRSIEALLKQKPDDAAVRLLKIETLIRWDRSTDLFAELDKRVEDLAWEKSQDQFRIASLLGHFGYIERAAAYAYRLFLENRDKAQAWMTLSTIVLEEKRGIENRPRRWDVSLVASDVAVDLLYDDGKKQFLVILDSVVFIV